MIYVAYSQEDGGYRPFDSGTEQKHDCPNWSSSSGFSTGGIRERPPARPQLNHSSSENNGNDQLLDKIYFLQKSMESVNENVNAMLKVESDILGLVQAIKKEQGLFKTASDLRSSDKDKEELAAEFSPQNDDQQPQQ